MKFFIQLFAGMALLLSSCSNAIDEDLFAEEVLIPVRLAVEEKSISTRAPINTIDASNLSSVGIYGVVESSTTGVFPWTSSPYASNIVPSGISGNQLSFSSKLYYPLGGKRVIFYGYYPRTTATSGSNYITVPGNGTAPVLNFTITGQEDIMQAVSTPSGSNNPATVALTFNHKLTQIQLNIGVLGALLTSIKILGVKNTGTMNIETGAISFGANITEFPFAIISLTSTNSLMVQADVPSYIVEASILGVLLPRKYLIKPTTGNFKAGMVYVISL